MNQFIVLLGGVVGFILIFTALIGSRLLAPFSKERQKLTTYECGMLPIRRASTNIGMRFYLYVILFIVFDVEAVFLFPWAIVFLDSIPAVFYEMLIFIAILLFGLAYCWRKGVLQWR